MKQRLNAVSSQVCSSQLFSSFMCNIVVDISCKWFNTLTCLVSYDKTWYRLHSYIFTVELCLLNKCLVSHIIAVELLLKGPTKSHLLKLENACKQSVPLQCKHFQATCISTDRIGAKNYSCPHQLSACHHALSRLPACITWECPVILCTQQTPITSLKSERTRGVTLFDCEQLPGALFKHYLQSFEIWLECSERPPPWTSCIRILPLKHSSAQHVYQLQAGRTTL